jgi:hypothetical protein
MGTPEQIQGASPEERLRRLERSLEEVTAERAELWAELHRRKALDHELEHYKYLVERFERSRSWRITAPLRSTVSFFDRLRAMARLARRKLRDL